MAQRTTQTMKKYVEVAAGPGGLRKAARKRKAAGKEGFAPRGPHYLAQAALRAGPGAPWTLKAVHVNGGAKNRNRLPAEFDAYVPTNFKHPLEVGDLVIVRARHRKPKLPEIGFRVAKKIGRVGHDGRAVDPALQKRNQRVIRFIEEW